MPLILDVRREGYFSNNIMKEVASRQLQCGACNVLRTMLFDERAVKSIKQHKRKLQRVYNRIWRHNNKLKHFILETPMG